MLVPFFYELRQARLPVSITEYLNFLGALQAGVGRNRVDDFYYLARTCLIKDEGHFDKFDHYLSC